MAFAINAARVITANPIVCKEDGIFTRPTSSNIDIAIPPKIVMVTGRLCFITVVSVVHVKLGCKRFIKRPNCAVSTANAMGVIIKNKACNALIGKATANNTALIIAAGIVIVKFTSNLDLKMISALTGKDLIIHKLVPSSDIEHEVEQLIHTITVMIMGDIVIKRSANPGVSINISICTGLKNNKAMPSINARIIPVAVFRTYSGEEK